VASPGFGRFITNRILSGTNSVVSNFLASAYGVELVQTNVTPSQGPAQTYADQPGRVDMTADTWLNLNNARIDALGSAVVRAHHLVGATNAVISSPFNDLDLGSTNGTLKVARWGLWMPTASSGLT
jgi:hypothetical protein